MIVTASNPIWIVFLSGAAISAIAAFWPRLHKWLRRTAWALAIAILGIGAWILGSNAAHGCYPLWTGLTPAVIGYAGNMTVCPGQTVVVPWEAILQHMPPLPLLPPPAGTGVKREERGRGI